MGFGGISVWSLLLILLIVVLLFGTKRLKNIGGDLGGAIKSFKKAVNEGEEEKSLTDKSGQTIEGKAEKKDKV
jgi:sec-independent protein translocase protein TatA